MSGSRLARLLATFFGCGFAPKGPGTAGSLGALAVAALVNWVAAPAPGTYGLLALVLLPLGIWASTIYARSVHSKDPQTVVVDEVIGQWITLSAAWHLRGWLPWLLAFVLFRAFDIVKPWPVRQFEKLPEGTGIVMDDVMAGVYGALVMWLLGWKNLY